MKNITKISKMPDNLRNHLACWLLHEHEKVLMPNLEIRYLCKECNEKSKNAYECTYT